MPDEITYLIAPKGLATSFTESELPPEYAYKFKNRVINAVGAAEKRQGIVRTRSAIPGNPDVTQEHEYISKTGVPTLFASSGGKIWKYDATANIWTLVYSGFASGSILQSVQMGDKLIFTDRVGRMQYTDDIGVTFKELIALIDQGATSSTTNTSFSDPDVSNWISGTQVNVNDLVYNVTRSGYGIITAVATTSLAHTSIGTSASSTGLGKTTGNPSNGDQYQIIDLVELNIIPTNAALDNVAVAGAGTNTTTIAVSGVSFSTTEARVGDYVYNSTIPAVVRIEAIATALTVTSAAGQTAGQALVFLKSAAPIADYLHVHYGRLYAIDARDKRKARVSGPNDPQDFSTDSATLDPITLNFDLSSQGDILKAIGSFQQFLVLGGSRGIYIYSGTTPTGANADFTPVAAFPQGIVSRDSFVDIGNDLLFVTTDGLQSVQFLLTGTTLRRRNISEPIRLTLRDLIKDADPNDIITIHYARRSWVLLKIGTQLYCYNYINEVNEAQNTLADGSWALFDGLFAQQKSFFIRQNGDLICGGGQGLVYDFDMGVYNDDGQAIPTEYTTGWLTLDGRRSLSVALKQGHYIKPLIQAGASINYTIQAEGGFEGMGNGSGAISTNGFATPIGLYIVGVNAIGGSTTQNVKVPLRWRGEVVRLTFTTNTTTGPDVLGRYTLYYNTHGIR